MRKHRLSTDKKLHKKAEACFFRTSGKFSRLFITSYRCLKSNTQNRFHQMTKNESRKLLWHSFQIVFHIILYDKLYLKKCEQNTSQRIKIGNYLVSSNNLNFKNEKDKKSKYKYKNGPTVQMTQFFAQCILWTKQTWNSTQKDKGRRCKTPEEKTLYK